MLCLAARVPQCRLVGLEMQRNLVRLAGDNTILNAMETRVSVMIGDLLRPPPRLSPGAFDHVMANPPYNERGRTAASTGKPKRPSKAMPILPPGSGLRSQWCGQRARSP